MPRLLAFLLPFLLALPVSAQTFATDEPVLSRIWTEGTERSQVYPLAQVLMDSIGPRLTGTPQQLAAHAWAQRTYERWGITARNEQYGTWRGWNRGAGHVDLISPRVRSLEATMLAWSPATEGRVEGRVILLPDLGDSLAFRRWLPQAAGAFVAISFPQPTCRPDDNWQEHARPETVERMQAERTAARQAWAARVQRTGLNTARLARALEDAGALLGPGRRGQHGEKDDSEYRTHL
jgi:carboxypeptidase Q